MRHGGVDRSKHDDRNLHDQSLISSQIPVCGALNYRVRSANQGSRIMTGLIERTFRRLGEQLPGRLSMPGDDRYAAATAIWHQTSIHFSESRDI
jgi:hypothetical protein